MARAKLNKYDQFNTEVQLESTLVEVHESLILWQSELGKSSNSLSVG